MVGSLCKTYKEYFPIGAAVNSFSIKTHKELIVNHFSGIIPENQMKPQFVHPAEHLYDFEQGDIIADFAEENNLSLRGHTLLWHNQTPDWFFKDGGGSVSRSLALKRMKEHIYTCNGTLQGPYLCVGCG